MIRNHPLSNGANCPRRTIHLRVCCPRMSCRCLSNAELGCTWKENRTVGTGLYRLDNFPRLPRNGGHRQVQCNQT